MNGENIPLQPNEEIKPIQGYEKLYSITSFGRVWSHRRINPHNKRVFKSKFLEGIKGSKGRYFRINLYKSSKQRMYHIHILTAQAFIPNPQNLPEVNHKDGNKKNNFAGTKEKNYEDGNLEWCTTQDNHNHALINGLKHKKTSRYYGVTYGKGLKGKNKWVFQIRHGGKQRHMGVFFTEIEAAKAYNDYVIKHNLNKPLNRIEGD